jgi:hypothetical protein
MPRRSRRGEAGLESNNDCDQPAATGTGIHAAGRKRGSVASFGSWAAVVAALDDRRPVGGGASYRAAAAGASIFFRAQRPGIRSGPAIAVTTRFRARSCTFLPIPGFRFPGFRSRKIRSKPSDAPDRLIFQRKFSIGSGRFPSNRERPARRTSPAMELRSRTDPIEASDVGAGKTGQRSFRRCWGLPTNDCGNRAAAKTL